MKELTFVLLHGFPQGRSSLEWMQYQLKLLGCPVLVPDLPGYLEGEGVSSRLDYRFSVIARGVAQDLQTKCGNYVVIGHDLGAAVGAVLSSLDPRCKGLVTVSLPHAAAFIISCFLSTQALRSWYFLPAQSYLFSRLLFNPERETSRQRLERMLSINGMSDTQVEKTMSCVFDRVGLKGPLRWYQAMPFESPKRLWAPVKVPWIQIYGELDVLCTEVSFELSARWARNNFSSIKIPGMTHWLDEDSSKVICRYVIEHFLMREGCAD